MQTNWIEKKAVASDSGDDIQQLNVTGEPVWRRVRHPPCERGGEGA